MCGKKWKTRLNNGASDLQSAKNGGGILLAQKLRLIILTAKKRLVVEDTKKQRGLYQQRFCSIFKLFT